MYETNAPRVYLVRQEGPDLPPSDRRSALLDEIRAASRSGAVALVLDLGAHASLDASAAAYWMGILEDRTADLAVLAVVTGARSLRLATLAFSAVVSFRHLPVEVRGHAHLDDAMSWATAALQRATAARRLARA